PVWEGEGRARAIPLFDPGFPCKENGYGKYAGGTGTRWRRAGSARRAAAMGTRTEQPCMAGAAVRPQGLQDPLHALDARLRLVGAQPAAVLPDLLFRLHHLHAPRRAELPRVPAARRRIVELLLRGNDERCQLAAHACRSSDQDRGPPPDHGLRRPDERGPPVHHQPAGAHRCHTRHRHADRSAGGVLSGADLRSRPPHAGHRAAACAALRALPRRRVPVEHCLADRLLADPNYLSRRDDAGELALDRLGQPGRPHHRRRTARLDLRMVAGAARPAADHDHVDRGLHPRIRGLPPDAGTVGGAPMTVAIQLRDVHKTFRIPHEVHTTLTERILAGFRGTTYERFEALRGIDLTIERGAFIGVIGGNGSGKSTLLKIMSGLLPPDRGEVHVDGSMSALLELGLGFSAELTVRENVELYAAVLGYPRREVKQRIEAAIAFAELDRFRDAKLKNLSTAMRARLGFATALQAECDILLLDEILAVGDESFQRKCIDVFLDLKRRRRTIILVSHDLHAIEALCDQAIYIEAGRGAAGGPPGRGL